MLKFLQTTSSSDTTINITVVGNVVMKAATEETLSISNVTVSPTRTVPLCNVTVCNTYCCVFCTSSTLALTLPCTDHNDIHELIVKGHYKLLPALYIHLQGGPTKTAQFLRYHIYAATTDVIKRFLLKCSEITAENNEQQFF